MKNLVLIRHAKSAWDDPFLKDHSRPLADRGLRDAPQMAQRLKRKYILPDGIISSDAERAKSTTLITCDFLKCKDAPIIYTRDLYHGSAEQILDTIHTAPDAWETLFVFGHNPGMNEFIWRTEGNIENLPTCGQYGLKFNVETWKEAQFDNASLWFFDYPKNK